jgi:hypothetical protein
MADPPTRAQIKLEVDRESEPITGVLEDERGERRPFLGWIELISAIEDARS